MPGLRELDPTLWPGHAALLAVDNVDALVSRGADEHDRVPHLELDDEARSISPTASIFDLDPGEGVTWPQIQEAALLMRAMLTELGLASWLKTSGGKGLHVVVPLAPSCDYDTVKGFSQAVVQHLARTIPAALRRQERRQQPRRPDLRRLPAQRPRARRRPPRSRRARGPASASRCRSPGSS